MIDAFIANVKTRGLARGNRFRVDIGFPPGIVLPYTRILSSMFCEVAGLPGYTIATQPHRTIGEPREVPYEPMYDPISLTFYMDSSFEIKDAFETWMSYIIDPVTKAHGYYNDYTTQIIITAENVDGSVPYQVILFEAYPKTMQTITLDQNNKEVLRLNIGLAYKYWRSNTLFQSTRNVPEPPKISNDPSIQGNSGYGR